MKLSIEGFSIKCDQIRNFFAILSYLLKKSLMGNFIFSAVPHTQTLTFKAICLRVFSK